ncbi:restriction endonuclease subunit S [Rhizobium sp. Leaf386]|uniref:restriction endonuclease subunit S n=1 Tax=Rhizobium sp. Leaf386 TaxID=1736359 RepID=UPI000715596D|nr:restriction endonuclease subunit S [Rhizobium sp. Leaf386]KQT04094.1 hypothetical protein ASG50_17955 [Rhizobium sp. Leaf386]
MKEEWEVSRLGDVCLVQSGAGFPIKYQGKTRGDYPFFKVSDMNADGNETSLIAAANYIDETERKALGARLFPPESVVFPKIGGAIATNKKRKIFTASCVDNNVMGLIPNQSRIRSDYLGWWLHGFDIYEFSNKANPPSITQPTVNDWPIPLPPLEEQQRIAAILEEAFHGLDRARANAEANLENARELYATAVSEIFAMAGEFTSDRKTLGEIAEFRNGLNFTRASSGERVKIVGVGDFKERFTVPVETLSDIVVNGALSSDDFLQEGDLLAVRSNGNKELIGRTMIVPTLSEKVSFSGFTIRIRLTTRELLPDYLCELMRTKPMRRIMIEGGGGANISNLNQKILANLPISFPGHEAQQLALERLSELADRISILVKAYQRKITDLADLRQSLLQEAFAGELT